MRKKEKLAYRELLVTEHYVDKDPSSHAVEPLSNK
jgi:hypothetical protein